VTDNRGATAYDNIRILVKPEPINISPVADAGYKIVITLPVDYTKIVSHSFDPDGIIVEYRWEQLKGPALATLSGKNSASLVINDLSQGSYTFRLTVTDNQGAKAYDDVMVIVKPEPVNILPVADAGEDRIITFPVSIVLLIGFGADPDGVITSYSWIQVSGPSASVLHGQNSTELTVSKLVEGNYLFRLYVEDNRGGISHDDVQVIVYPEPINQAPVADAGDDVFLDMPVDDYWLIGESYDTDGFIREVSWQQSNGPNFLLGPHYSDSLNLGGISEGTYVFEYMVVDAEGAKISDFVTVEVERQEFVLEADKFFSPDGNGINDVWKIRNLENFDNPELLIFNRFGQLVYESASYANDWRGSMVNGKPLPDGDYYYILKSENLSDPLTGAVRIIRDY
jgi:gliding motility-associated-like protein